MKKIKNNIARHSNATSNIEFGNKVKTWLELQDKEINNEMSKSHASELRSSCLLWKPGSVGPVDC